MSLEEYADKFRPRNKYVPEQLYGKLAKLENITEQQRKLAELERNNVVQPSRPASGANQVDLGARVTQNLTKKARPEKLIEAAPEAAKGRVMVNLRRSEGDVWSASQPVTSKPDPAPNPGPDAMTIPTLNVNQTIVSVADNVTSFLSGIRASFRSDNVNVSSLNQPKKSNQVNENRKDYNCA